MEVAKKISSRKDFLDIHRTYSFDQQLKKEQKAAQHYFYVDEAFFTDGKSSLLLSYPADVKIKGVSSFTQSSIGKYSRRSCDTAFSFLENDLATKSSKRIQISQPATLGKKRNAFVMLSELNLAEEFESIFFPYSMTQQAASRGSGMRPQIIQVHYPIANDGNGKELPTNGLYNTGTVLSPSSNFTGYDQAIRSLFQQALAIFQRYVVEQTAAKSAMFRISDGVKTDTT